MSNLRLILQSIWQTFLDSLKNPKSKPVKSFPVEPSESKICSADSNKPETNLYVIDSNMRTSKSGISLIKEFEGLHKLRSDGQVESYPCSAGVWTIGYGHTKYVFPGMVITKKEAEDLLVEDLKDAEDIVNKLVKIDLDQNQFDALVSFVFNIGEGAFERSTILRRINENQIELAGLEFDRWVYANGKRLAGLQNRRQKEYELFMTYNRIT